MDRFYIDKGTGTFADELVVGGFVRLLMEVGPSVMGRRLTVVQYDRGAYYEVECTPAVDVAELAGFEGFLSVAPVIQTAKNKKKLPDELPMGAKSLVDYEAEREQRGVYLAAWKNLSKTAKRADILGEHDAELLTLPPGPHPDWHLLGLQEFAWSIDSGLSIQPITFKAKVNSTKKVFYVSKTVTTSFYNF